MLSESPSAGTHRSPTGDLQKKRNLLIFDICRTIERRASALKPAFSIAASRCAWSRASSAVARSTLMAGRCSEPSPATELMVAYAYDTVQRRNPVGFFGMVHVLEGTSVTTADRAADAIKQALDLPDKAFSYLRSHGALDVEHCAFFESLMEKITDREDQDCIVHSARMFYRLYADIFRTLPTDVAQAA